MSDDARYKDAMREKKAEHDLKLGEMREGQGLLLVYTGNGKGKSTAAFGLIARALGTGLRIGVVQYIKGKWITGEKRFFARFKDEIRFHVMGEGFTWETQDKAIDRAAAAAAWTVSCEMIADPSLDLVILDELNVAMSLGQLEVAPVVEAIKSRPHPKHVCVTGRNAPDALVEIADLVTEMRQVKHPFERGIKAVRGIDF